MYMYIYYPTFTECGQYSKYRGGSAGQCSLASLRNEDADCAAGADFVTKWLYPAFCNDINSSNKKSNNNRNKTCFHFCKLDIDSQSTQKMHRKDQGNLCLVRHSKQPSWITSFTP